MKTNEAPEKIYINSNIENRTWLIGKGDTSFIEYTRTDAFIEKAEKFLEDKLTEEGCKFGWNEWTKVKSGYNPIDSFMRAFRNYMKGE